MNSDCISDICDVFLSASLPLDPDEMPLAAEKAIAYYASASKSIALPAEEVAERFAELWGLWFSADNNSQPSRELKDTVREAVGVNPNMNSLAREYFTVERKLEQKAFMSRSNAVALIGCAPLIRTLVTEHHLGLDRIRAIVNIPGATFDAIRSVLNAMGIGAAFDPNEIQKLHASDINDVAGYFGDTLPDDAAGTFKSLLGTFAHSRELWESVTELSYIGFEPYLFLLYYELLTLESTDRFPGRAIYEHGPRSSKVKQLWNSMYNPTQENPYLNNAKSVYSLDESWAETKLSSETQNGSLMLSNIFDIMSELPYTTRRRVARITRCYLILLANKRQTVTPLPPILPHQIRSFVERVSNRNSLTKGVLDQRLVDFATMCRYDCDNWVVRGLGSSVNESNASGRKYGDVEYLDAQSKTVIRAYEAHGGSLRDEYVASHVRSLKGTVKYHAREAQDRGENYYRQVEIVYVAHDTSKLAYYENGHRETIQGLPFTFRFITFRQLLDEVGGIEFLTSRGELYDTLIHQRISRLPDVYTLKKKYASIINNQ